MQEFSSIPKKLRHQGKENEVMIDFPLVKMVENMVSTLKKWLSTHLKTSFVNALMYDMDFTSSSVNAPFVSIESTSFRTFSCTTGFWANRFSPTATALAVCK